IPITASGYEHWDATVPAIVLSPIPQLRAWCDGRGPEPSKMKVQAILWQNNGPIPGSFPAEAASNRGRCARAESSGHVPAVMLRQASTRRVGNAASTYFGRAARSRPLGGAHAGDERPGGRRIGGSQTCRNAWRASG